MLVSVLIYCVTAAVLCILGCYASQRKGNTLHAMNLGQLVSKNWELIAAVLVIAVVAGARWHTGFDHEMYLDQYQDLLNGRSETMGRDRYEWGFVAISLRGCESTISSTSPSGHCCKPRCSTMPFVTGVSCCRGLG